MKRIFAFILLWLGYTITCFAQGGFASFNDYTRSPISSQLFRLNPEQYNNHFEFALPDNGKLEVDFLRLSDWGAQNQLQAITDLVSNQVRLLKDSFSNNYSYKLMEINIPINGQVISVNYREDESGRRQLAYKDGGYYQLKTGFDTIRVVKNVRIRTEPVFDSGLVQVQYTYILKDINDIQILTDKPELLRHIGALADAAIAAQRNRWHRQDASYHTFDLKYDPEAPTPLIKNNHSGSFLSFMRKRFALYLGFGMIAYSDNGVGIAPYVDETFAYLVPSRAKMQPFVGLNLTGFGFVNKDANGSRKSYAAINFEYGVCSRAPGFMQQKSSVAFGIMTRYSDSGDRKVLFNMGLNFGFNSFLSGGVNIASDLKKDSKNSLLGIVFKFNF